MKICYGAVLLAALHALPAVAEPTVPGRQSPEQRIAILERQVRALTGMVVRLDTLTREMQQLRGEVELQSHAMDALKERQRDIYLDLDKRVTRLSEGGVAVAPLPTAAATTATPEGAAMTPPTGSAISTGSSISTHGGVLPPIPVDLPPGDPAKESQRYREAFEMLRKGQYAEARNALRTFLVQYPDSGRADNAQYWLAEAGYVTKDFASALVEFSTLVSKYPESTKVPDALLKSGYIRYESQQYDEARTMLKKVVKEHSGSTAARLAQKQLDRMDRESR